MRALIRTSPTAKSSSPDLVEGDPAADLPQLEREERRAEQRGDRLLQRLGTRPRTVDVQLGPLHEERSEERQPQNVIEVEMRQEDRCPQGASVGRYPLRQALTHRTQSGAEVEDQRRPVRRADQPCRGVPTVEPVAVPRARARPPCAEERHIHAQRLPVGVRSMRWQARDQGQPATGVSPGSACAYGEAVKPG